MNTSIFNIREAAPADNHQVAPLIVNAMGDLACTFANTKIPSQAIPLFEHFFQLPQNQYSFENTLIYEIDREIVGSIIGYDGQDLLSLRKPFLKYIEAEHGAILKNLEAETEAGEFYLDTLSVSPNFQGKGIGSALIKAMIIRAQKEGHQKVGLLVDLKNAEAKKLYIRLGFKVVGQRVLAGGNYEHLVCDWKRTLQLY